MKKVRRWLGPIADVTGILTFLGFGASWLFGLRPLFLGLAGLGLGIVLGRRIGRLDRLEAAARSPTLAPPSSVVVDSRASLVEVGRELAVKLTSEAWAEFPTWKWTLRDSKQALAIATDRVLERAIPGMSQADAQDLVRESIRMWISETLAHRVAEEQANATRRLRHEEGWVMRGLPPSRR